MKNENTEFEYHSLCDKCGDLLVEDHKPTEYELVFCSSCNTLFPDGLSDSSWGEWPKNGPPDWSGCA